MNAILLAAAIGASVCSQSTPPAPAPAPAAAPPANAAGPYKVLSTFEVGGEGGWDYLNIDSGAKRLYVSRGSRAIVIDTESGKQVGEVPNTAGIHGIALAPQLGKGFTSNGRSDDVTIFDLKTLAVEKTVNAGKNPDAIMFEPVTKRVFAFNGRSSDATVINAEDGSVVATIPLGGKPEFAVHDGAGKVFVNIEDTSEVVRIDAQGAKVEQRWSISPGNEPSGLAIDPPNHRLYSVCANQMMVVLDSETGKVIATPPIGKRVDGAAFDPINGYALSSNGDGTVTVVSAKTNAVVQNLPTAAGARTIVFDPATHRAYLPSAEFEPAAPAKEGAQPQRPKMKANTFKVVVIGT